MEAPCTEGQRPPLAEPGGASLEKTSLRSRAPVIPPRLKTRRSTCRTCTHGRGRTQRTGSRLSPEGSSTVHTRSRSLTLSLLTCLFVASGCSGLATLGMKQKGGLERVDELLSHVERVQVEATVAKERVEGALDSLRKLIAPGFKGEPTVAHAELVSAVEQSSEQAKTLQRSVKPLRKTGESVFARWTEDLEAFGNLAMRQRSQERLEETRRRYDAILAAAVAAQLAYDSFNGDLSDHALFLEHDFNATSVALMGQELDGLRNRAKELAKRLDACAASCQAYVEFSAPSAQLAPLEEVPVAKPEAEAAPAPKAPAKKPAPPKKNPAPKPAPKGG